MELTGSHMIRPLCDSLEETWAVEVTWKRKGSVCMLNCLILIVWPGSQWEHVEGIQTLTGGQMAQQKQEGTFTLSLMCTMLHLHTSTTSINTDYKLRCHKYKNLKGAFKNTDMVLYKGLSLHDFLVFSIFVSLSCFRSLQTCWYETKMGCVSLSQTLSAECPPHISRCFAIFKWGL